ncbi:FAD-dependent oxidoreductase [Methylobacterium komagatae]|uniref:FAD-dependent oxidoreductase n=1 Tax=Methylobacterium komagatae TaxID=374425 RepID=A0ABW2BI37_9HYPH
MASRSLSASRRGGVRSIVVDQKRELDTHSRAIALFPRTLEIFRSLGVVEDLIVSGEQSSHLRLRRASDRKTLIDFDFGTYDPITQCNYLLAIPQNRTERVLFEHAQRNDRIEPAYGMLVRSIRGR